MMIRDNNLACCYFPTTALFIDDRIEFLKNLSLGFDRKLAYQLNRNPHQALHFIKNEYQAKLLMHAHINVDISTIHHEIYSEERFNEISVIVVDYAMPGMTGLEFCEQLRDNSIKKMILTGQADTSMVGQAFNDEVIDLFMLKDAPDFDNVLNNSIRRLQRGYFQELSNIVMKNLAADPNSCIGDSVFIDFFAQLRQEHNVLEYYLVDDSGCFLLLDIYGNPSWLVVKSEQHMKKYLQMARDDNAPSAIIDALRSKEKVLFLFAPEEDAIPVVGWGDYLHPATELVGENNKYYYAFVKGVAGYKIYPEKIVSYQSYLEKS